MESRRKRSPDGVNYTKPIALRLMPIERENAELISKRLGKTKSALAREAYLAGLPIVINRLNTADSSPAVPPGGTDRIISTASFSSKPAGKS